MSTDKHKKDPKQAQKRALSLKLLKKSYHYHDDTQGMTLIEKAYIFAREKHAEQKRYSGEPYFNHVVATAKILASLKMSAIVVAAGLLHDTLEDTDTTTEEIEKEFGPEILFLVEGVTKLGQLRYRGAERHAESLRKLFVATSQDVRVLIIKLADRLHNIRTLQYVPEDKQLRIASETLEIYAPLAYRLGIRNIVKELMDGCFPFVYPEEYKATKAILEEREKELRKKLHHIHNDIKRHLYKADIRDFTSERRIKSLFSLWEKLKRKDMDINQVHDLAAIRFIVPDVGDCYKTLGVVHGCYRPVPGRVKDYISFPKPNGYQSLHTDIFAGGNDVIEIQIRTADMHREAEFGIASHLTYKETKGSENKKMNPTFVWLRSLLPGSLVRQPDNKPAPPIEKNVDVPTWIKQLTEYQEEVYGEEFIKNLKTDFFENRMFVFTPKKDVVDLPKGSNVIDFAYAIHTDIGNKLYSGKINGKLVSIDTVIHNGDYVDVQTHKNSHPNHKWLDGVKTTLAKKNIRQYLKDQEEIKSGSK